MPAMPSLLTTAAAALLVLLAAAPAAQAAPRRGRAQPLAPGQVARHVLQEELPSPHPDVETSFALMTDKGEWVSLDAVPAGRTLMLVCGFANTGTARLNVSGIAGLLSDHFNNDRAVSPLPGTEIAYLSDPHAADDETAAAAGSGGAAGVPLSEVSLSYSFAMPKTFQGLDPQFRGFPHKLRLSAAVFYDLDGREPFASAFFNSTITVVAPQVNMTSLVFAALPYVFGVVTFLVVLLTIFDSVPQVAAAVGQRNGLDIMKLAWRAGWDLVLAIFCGCSCCSKRGPTATGGGDSGSGSSSGVSSIGSIPSASKAVKEVTFPSIIARRKKD